MTTTTIQPGQYPHLVPCCDDARHASGLELARYQEPWLPLDDRHSWQYDADEELPWYVGLFLVAAATEYAEDDRDSYGTAVPTGRPIRFCPFCAAPVSVEARSFS